jgi:hypothetical protein
MKRKLHTFGLTTQRLRYIIVFIISLLISTLASNSVYAADVNTATISISPSQVTLSGNTPESNTIDLDSGPETVAFVHTKIIFNPDIIQLATEIVPSPLFNTVINTTLMDEANKTGVIDLTLGISPDNLSNAPSGKFNIASLNWVTNTNPSNQLTTIAFTENTSQIANADALNVPFQTQDGIISIDNTISEPTDTPSPTLTANPSSTASPTPTPIYTTTPSPIPTILPTVSPTPFATETPTPQPSSSPLPFSYGLIGSYYNGKGFNDFVFKRIDPKINFNWWMGSPANGVHINRFSVRWTGFFKPIKSGRYNFYTKSDDGVRLWLNNNLIINNWNDHDLTEKSKSVNLEAGHMYPIKIEYYENTGRAQIQLYFSGPDIKKRTIPSDLFIP